MIWLLCSCKDLPLLLAVRPATDAATPGRVSGKTQTPTDLIKGAGHDGLANASSSAARGTRSPATNTSSLLTSSRSCGGTGAAAIRSATASVVSAVTPASSPARGHHP